MRLLVVIIPAALAIYLLVQAAHMLTTIGGAL